MRIIICDDDKMFIQELRKKLEDFFDNTSWQDYEIVEFTSGDKLLEDTGEKDIVFLDIEMPGLDGIYTGKKITENYPKSIIIIVTSFSEYLDDAMKFSVFRYLSKPIDRARLYRNLQDAVDVYRNRHHSLVIDCEGECRKIDSDEIIMLEAQKRKIIMYTENNQYEVTGTMKEWNEKLSFPCFFQCHRSYIVNVAKISSIKDDMIFLKHGEYRAYLTKRKHAEVKNRFMLYLEKNR